jgi:hypothetical protein
VFSATNSLRLPPSPRRRARRGPPSANIQLIRPVAPAQYSPITPEDLPISMLARVPRLYAYPAARLFSLTHPLITDCSPLILHLLRSPRVAVPQSRPAAMTLQAFSIRPRGRPASATCPTRLHSAERGRLMHHGMHKSPAVNHHLTVNTFHHRLTARCPAGVSLRTVALATSRQVSACINHASTLVQYPIQLVATSQ